MYRQSFCGVGTLLHLPNMSAVYHMHACVCVVTNRRGGSRQSCEKSNKLPIRLQLWFDPRSEADEEGGYREVRLRGVSPVHHRTSSCVLVTNKVTSAPSGAE